MVKKLNFFAKKFGTTKTHPFRGSRSPEGPEKAQGLQTRTSVQTALHKKATV
jgi:hypothetical protein